MCGVRHDVRGGGAGHMLLHHPVHGAAAFSHATFRATEDPALSLAIYVPEDGERGWRFAWGCGCSSAPRVTCG